MRLTDIFKFKLFDRTDKADLDVVNENFQNAETALNNCMQPRNIFTGDIDTLRSTGKAGAYWVHPVSKGTTSATDSFPFADGENYYDLYVFVKNASDSTQMAIRFDADGKHDVRYRMYANGKWYPWSTALGKTDISTIGDGTITGAIGELLKKLTSHKSSGDHDGRYLQKSAVINNNTTTEAGYALDARQANPNVSGSLGAQISELSTNLSNKILKIEKTYTSPQIQIGANAYNAFTFNDFKDMKSDYVLLSTNVEVDKDLVFTDFHYQKDSTLRVSFFNAYGAEQTVAITVIRQIWLKTA